VEKSLTVQCEGFQEKQWSAVLAQTFYPGKRQKKTTAKLTDGPLEKSYGWAD